MTKPWNMAAWRQNTYREPVRKMHGPVGGLCDVDEEYELSALDSLPRRFFNASNGEMAHRVCFGCGFHVCSCALNTELEAHQFNARLFQERYGNQFDPTYQQQPPQPDCIPEASEID